MKVSTFIWELISDERAATAPCFCLIEAVFFTADLKT